MFSEVRALAVGDDVSRRGLSAADRPRFAESTFGRAEAFVERVDDLTRCRFVSSTMVRPSDDPEACRLPAAREV